MKTIQDMSTDSRKKLANTLFILGGIIAIAVVVLVTLKQDAGVLDASLIMTGTMLIVLGNIIGRNKQQCSGEDAGTKKSTKDIEL
jgi:VIT1/CCC1 family predicted Fe2+/Mn2+ transporter